MQTRDDMTPWWVEQQVPLVLGVGPYAQSSMGEGLHYWWKVTAPAAKHLGTITRCDNHPRPTSKLKNSH
jgi:hypothetical protein